jgi:hypothetical protein
VKCKFVLFHRSSPFIVAVLQPFLCSAFCVGKMYDEVIFRLYDKNF